MHSLTNRGYERWLNATMNFFGFNIGPWKLWKKKSFWISFNAAVSGIETEKLSELYGEQLEKFAVVSMSTNGQAILPPVTGGGVNHRKFGCSIRDEEELTRFYYRIVSHNMPDLASWPLPDLQHET
ncbi:unnamed protein product [Ilex paraguariensis]|uniref:Uncharacterized protein n=1 Tax=Ilex paraguariensis TaxID=185542 RepID=A0ABC8SUF2_9AQUA